MRIIPILLLLISVLRCGAEPILVLSDARVESYRKLSIEKQPIAYVDGDFKKVIQILIEKAASPTTPADICAASDVEEIILRVKPVNRPSDFNLPDFMKIWAFGALTGAVGGGEVSLAPDTGFILLKNGNIIPFDLYGNDSIRIWGFMFRNNRAADQIDAAKP